MAIRHLTVTRSLLLSTFVVSFFTFSGVAFGGESSAGESSAVESADGESGDQGGSSVAYVGVGYVDSGLGASGALACYHSGEESGGGTGAPDGPGFPPAGNDFSPTTGIFRVDVGGLGPVETKASGMTLLQWSDPVIDLTGGRVVHTELQYLDLHGSSPALGNFDLRAGSVLGMPPSLGQVRPVAPPPGPDFPATAFFDVFFQVTINGTTTLQNDQPLRMEAEINEIPPRNIGLRNASPVLIQNSLDPQQVAVLSTAQHWMCPPPFPPPGVPCPVPCAQAPFPVCSPGDCPPGFCSGGGATCQVNSDCPVGDICIGAQQCVRNSATQSCECKPTFPPAGTDFSPTTGIFRVDVTGLGPVDTSVAGNTLLQWQNPTIDALGQKVVQTEMLQMNLTGSSPGIGNLQVRAGSAFGLPPTLGTVKPIDPVSDFPASAFFDVFFEITVNGITTLRNSQPLVMEADITEIPPRNIGLRNAAPVQIKDIAPPGQIHTIQRAQHWMCPPPFPPPGVPCPVPCERAPYPVCKPGTCPSPTQLCRPLAPFFPQDGYEGTCVCVEAFPLAGTDSSPTVGTFRVDLDGIGPVETGVSGQTLLQWQNPVIDPGTGQRRVDTEMLSLDLVGSSPVGSLQIRGGSAQGLPPSLGRVVPQGPGSDFPATAFFDVFFEVEVNGTTTLVNDQPLVMRAPITEIPPRSIGLQNAAPVPLRNLANPSQINTIQTAQHWMCPPPFPPPGVPCPVPCERNPWPLCKLGACPPDRPICVPDPTTRACRCTKPGFPPKGADLSPTSGIFRVSIDGLGLADAKVSGEVLLRWQDPILGPLGERMVPTEMLSLNLTGSSPTLGPIQITGGSNNGLPPSLGRVTAQGPGSDFPALAFFDVFFEVSVPGATLVNDQPLVMEADINEIPPRNLALRNAAPVPLRNLADPAQNNSIQTAAHWMCPPPYPPTGVPCPLPCNGVPYPLCSLGVCPPGLTCLSLAGTPCTCVASLAPTSGEAPFAGVAPLRVTKAAGGQLALSWGTSCISTDTDYGIYEGLVPSYASHTAKMCSTGGATNMTLAPASGSRYYLVVPHGASVEGSYGRRKTGPERPQGSLACLPQSIGTCP